MDFYTLFPKPDKYRDFLLQLMINYNASDMYLTYGEPPALRIHGEVKRIKNISVEKNGEKINIELPNFDDELLTQIAYYFMDEFEGEKFRQDLDIDLGYSYQNRRFRLNISLQQKHIMIVIRLLAERILTIDELGLPEVFKDLVKRKAGIILVAGPTGSGKSTTLAAMIEEINQNEAKHIITIEDPIEYVFTPKKSVIEQKQLGSDTHSYARALRAALRQKPDVVLFGEMRDIDSIKNAITLAETGHLVISTIHSKSSAQTISKIADSFPPEQQQQIRVQLADTLVATINQRLVQNIDKTGMVLALEIMINTPAVANLIRENKISQINNVIQTSKSKEMILLEDHLVELVYKGIISPYVAIANANNVEYLINELKNKGIKI